MIVDGKAIAEAIYAETKASVLVCPHPPVLAAIACAPNFETQKYLELKKQKASEVGITLRVVELPETTTTEEAIACVKAVAAQVDGVVVQLPFPSHIDREAVLKTVPVEKDPDGFAYSVHDNACVPPVTGAILEIAKTYKVSFEGKSIVVLGQGRLVGGPIVQYLNSQKVDMTVLTEANSNHSEILKTADVLITGIGKPHFVTPNMVKEGVIIFDAGTSEDGGVMVGDVHPDIAKKASLFTPVPGGIGPITVAVLLRNLVKLVQR